MNIKPIVIILFIVIVSAVIIGVFLYKKGVENSQKTLYEVAIMVRSQSVADPEEDLRSSLKAGDVLAIQNAGHSWSTSEKISYLILRMELIDEQKAKLLAPKTRIRDKDELSESERRRLEEEEGQLKGRGEENTPEILKEVLILREYRIDFDKLPEFSANDLLSGQPFFDKVYGWGIVERKK